MEDDELDKIPQERLDEIDRLYISPKEQAEEVNGILQTAAKELGMDHNLFNITCFSIQWLAMLATSTLTDDVDFVRIARLANIWLHHKHYNEPKEIYGEPNKKAKIDLISLDDETESKETS